MEVAYKIALLLACCMLATVAAMTPDSLTRTGDISLMQFMVRSSELSQRNPQRSLACFDYYLPLLNAISDQYEKDYAACQAKANSSRCGVDNATKAEQEQMSVAAKDACNLLSSCNQYTNAIPYFECYAYAGAQDSKTMYAISANASAILAALRERYYIIESDEYRCTNASQRAYVENTAVEYENLQSCLEGKTQVPSTTTPTTTPSNLIATTANATAAAAVNKGAAATVKPKRARRQRTVNGTIPLAVVQTQESAIAEQRYI